MSTLVDWQIAKLVKTSALVSPYNPDQQNPASYDVTLGSTVLVEQGCNFQDWKEIDIRENCYRFEPGEFLLAATHETISLPADIEAVFYLKSSRGREGYNHMLATYCDPGFHGQVTLELHNANKYRCLYLRAGMKIGQLRFARLNGIPLRTYDQTGRYNGQQGPTVSKG